MSRRNNQKRNYRKHHTRLPVIFIKNFYEAIWTGIIFNREKNGLLTSLDKERKDNLLKKGNKMITELEDRMKFLETAEKLLSKKSQILGIRNSVTTLLDDFIKNWEHSGPQALRPVIKTN